VYGREGRAVYAETAAGFGIAPRFYELSGSASAYRRTPGLTPRPPLPRGAGDHDVMSYCYRLCLTDQGHGTRIAAPAAYDPERYRLLTHPDAPPYVFHLSALPNGKYDLNVGHNVLDVDFISGNRGFSTGDHAARTRIAAEHRSYQQGLLYYLATDPSVPAAVRDRASSLRLASDEFTKTGHWPTQLYVREASRLVGMYVMRQSDLTTHRTKIDSIGMGSYMVDVHGVRRYVESGRMTIEGGIPTSTIKVHPYQIPYRSLLPKPTQVSNLICAMPISVSHVVWGSIRMEPQFMTTGEAAGAAATLSVVHKTPLAKLGGSGLTAHLHHHGVVTSL